MSNGADGHNQVDDTLVDLTQRPNLDNHPAVQALTNDLTDPELAQGVIELFERARQSAIDGNTDLIVLSARRLACLYQLAVDNGLERIEECAVVSDRYLDVAPFAHRTWSRALILDDSVVLGTTIRRLTEKVMRIVGPTGVVRTAAVVRDTDQSAEFLLEGLRFAALHERSREAVEEFSLNVVQTLFRHQIPFFSDFPVTSSVDVPAEQWQDYLSNGPWAVADVTAPLIGDESRSALVLVPTDTMVEAVLTRLPPAVGALVESFKLRAYAIRLSSDTCRLRLVPIAMLGPSRVPSLDEAIREIGECLQLDDLHSLAVERATPEAKHRLVQIFASAIVLAAFIGPSADNNLPDAGSDSCAELARLLQPGGLDPTQTELYFGQFGTAADTVFQRLLEWLAKHPAGTNPRPYNESPARPDKSTLLRDAGVRHMLWEQRELLALTEMPAMPQPGYITKIGLIFGSSLSSVFGFISRTIELQQREDIKALQSLDAFEASALSGPMRVLNQGLTLPELTDALCPELASGPTWTRSLMSLGVDIGNDLGIIVPATQTDSTGMVYRCYRLGETAYLAGMPLPQAARQFKAAWTVTHSIPTGPPSPLHGHKLGKPAMRTWTTSWDRMSQSVADGFPVTSNAVHIRSNWWARLVDLADAAPTKHVFSVHGTIPLNPKALESLTALQKVVLHAVPGPMLERFDGHVIRHTDADFDVHMTQSSDGAIATAKLPTRLVDDNDLEWLRDGAQFVWTIYDVDDSERGVDDDALENRNVTDGGPDAEDGGNLTTTSRVRFVKHAPLDLDAMERAADANAPTLDAPLLSRAE